MKGSLIIVSFFIAGIICGMTGAVSIESLEIDISFYALAALMFCVGIGVGSDTDSLRDLRSLDMRYLSLPVFTISGTLLACLLISFLLPWRTSSECLAVGSGFGYYSLSSIFITEYKGAELGTVALLANISREIITVLFAPLLLKLFGRFAPIAAGGATTMDTTLPIITQTSGSSLVILSIFHGFIVDFSVPLLVTLFCSL